MKNTFEAVFSVIAIGVIIGIACFLGVALGMQGTPSLGGFATESTAQVASSSIVVVGPQQIITIFSANTSCANRIIALPPGGANVFLSFSSSVLPSVTVGYPVVASSTNPLPASQYGCGAVRAYAPASTTITRTEYIR